METYEIELEEARAKSAAIVFKKYLTRPDTSDSGVDTCENEVLFTFTIINLSKENSRCIGKNSRDISIFLQESTSGSGSLFIDRLNEETIKKVSDKLEGGERDLFAPCVKDVKALLSKEPFQEFLK